MSARLQRIQFEGATVLELVQQCRAFIGESQVAPMITTRYGTGNIMKTWPVPSWAPKGSKWEPSNSPPTLIGPDGRVVAVKWVAGTAQKPPNTKRT